MSAKHTPGPWRFGRVADSARVPEWFIGPKVPSDVASVSVMHDTFRSLEEHEANARLMASSPELLAALEALLEDALEIQALRKSIYQRSGTPFTPSAKIAQAEAVIRKVKGEA